MSKKRHCNTSTKKRQTHQSPWQPKVYLTLKTGYKIATKATAKDRSADQTGYIKGWYIDENVGAKILPGLAVFLDFDKAFLGSWQT